MRNFIYLVLPIMFLPQPQFILVLQGSMSNMASRNKFKTLFPKDHLSVRIWESRLQFLRIRNIISIKTHVTLQCIWKQIWDQSFCSLGALPVTQRHLITNKLHKILWIIKYTNYLRLFKMYMPQCEPELTN